MRIWRFILAYGDRKKAICFDKYCNLTVKIKTQSNRNGMVGENYVWSTFPIVTLFEKHKSCYDVSNLEHLWNLWLRTNGIVSHITALHFLVFISRNNTATLHSGNLPVWVLLIDESGRLSQITKQRAPQIFQNQICLVLSFLFLWLLAK